MPTLVLKGYLVEIDYNNKLLSGLLTAMLQSFFTILGSSVK